MGKYIDVDKDGKSWINPIVDFYKPYVRARDAWNKDKASANKKRLKQLKRRLKRTWNNFKNHPDYYDGIMGRRYW